MLLGESGCGKTSLARIFARGAGVPFVTLACGDISPTLLEIRLFGSRKGGYTDSTHDLTGVFEEADGGVLFLDDLHVLPKDLQAKLFRIAETGLFRPVGDDEERHVQVRLVVGSAVPLQDLHDSGRLTTDLRWRLCGETFFVPPARERPQDVVALVVRVFKEESAKSPRSGGRRLDPEVLRAFAEYHWPGNFRQVVGAARIAAHLDVDVVKPVHLPFLLQAPMEASPLLTLAQVTDRARELEVRRRLAIFEGDFDRAADSLESDRATLYRILKKATLEGERIPPSP